MISKSRLTTLIAAAVLATGVAAVTAPAATATATSSRIAANDDCPFTVLQDTKKWLGATSERWDGEWKKGVIIYADITSLTSGRYQTTTNYWVSSNHIKRLSDGKCLP
ncbi:hypothetical protein ABZ897_25835 [Nonomuraea sp. NPDC046802]|uniref:hypothetical protein n=1 Tax=Nonomuraea sp. NPDC046802 TaxID=3154919 RepID=UPI0033CDD4BC